MQNLFHDGGFSSMGMSLRAIQQYEKSFEDCPPVGDDIPFDDKEVERFR